MTSQLNELTADLEVAWNLCKVFEKVIFKYIVTVASPLWLTSNHHGFLHGQFTLDAAVKVLFDIHKAFDRNISVLAFFFDFANAFDLVP